MVVLVHFQRSTDSVESGLKVNIPPNARTVRALNEANAHIYDALKKVPLAECRIDESCSKCVLDYSPGLGWQDLVGFAVYGNFNRGAFYEAAGMVLAAQQMKKQEERAKAGGVAVADDKTDLQLCHLYLLMCIKAIESELPHLGIGPTDEIKKIAAEFHPTFPKALLEEDVPRLAQGIVGNANPQGA
jgi:hypothetical protein